MKPYWEDDNSPNGDMTLPGFYDALEKAKRAVKNAKELALAHPNDTAIQIMLDDVNALLAALFVADDRNFKRYALRDLHAMIENDPEYPHSIRVWYYNEFLPEMFGDEDEK